MWSCCLVQDADSATAPESLVFGPTEGLISSTVGLKVTVLVLLDGDWTVAGIGICVGDSCWVPCTLGFAVASLF